jgi:uncharacterized protein (TIGR03437 family)
MSSTATRTRVGILFLAVLLVLLVFPATVRGQATTEFTVSTSIPGARFKVDGQDYISQARFNWPVGSRHVLEFPVALDLGGYQFNALFTVRYSFGGWMDDRGLLSPGAERTQVVTASPEVKSYVANVSVEYLLKLVFFDTLPTPAPFGSTSPSVCGAPGDPDPPEFRVGVVYIDGVCYWNNVELWMVSGIHTLNAFPYPGYVFLSWKADVTPPSAFLRTFEVNGPMVLHARFSPAKRVNFRTDPPGLQVKVDGTPIRTTEIEPCEPNNLLPPGAPLTSKPMCVGEFDFAPGSRHVIGAVSPQVDRFGRTWVFTGFSNGWGQDTVYVTPETIWPEENLLAQFVRGTRVSLATKPAGFALSVDNAPPAVNNNYVFVPGSRHTVSAPAEQVDARGRRYRFKRWSNGGPATQEFTVPEILDLNFHLEAEYELLNRLVVTANQQGAAVLVDGEQCLTPCTIDRPAGADVRLEPPGQLLAGEGRRLEFIRWGDAEGRARLVTIPAADPPPLEILYAVSFLLQTALDPEEGGRIVFAPPSADGFYREGTRVGLTAEPARGYRFRRWDYDAQGTDPNTAVLMAAPRAVAARFDKLNLLPELIIRNAAGGADNVVAAGSLISIFGANLAPRYEAAPTGPFLPQALAGVSVTVEDRILPLLFVSPEQINAQLPRDLAPGDYELRVIRAGAPDQRGKFRVERASPGLFSQQIDQRAWAVAQHEDGTPVTLQAPARAGELISLAATGLGPYQLAVREGVTLPLLPAYPLEDPLELRAGETPLEVEWAGGQAGQAGMDVIRFRVPASVAGVTAFEVTVKCGARISNAVLVPVR